VAITGLHHAQITIPPGCEPDARDFYCGLLGLPEVEKPDVLKPRGGFWLQLGDQQVHVGVEDGVDRQATRAHLAYLVDDLAAWRARLAAAGVEVIDAVALPGLERFEARDPFGNRIEFLQTAS
jgi:catechol 2,3-dioxygenase-like lactoylglutathione lyase family enzyme